jgi:SAM-dependent methyltransferase
MLNKESDKNYFDYLAKRSVIGAIYRNFILYPRLNRFLKGNALDVGCGIGDMLAFRANTVGVDVNSYNVDFCQKRKLDASLMKQDQLAFESESFDSVLLDNVLEHIESPRLLLTEIKRVLKPGGVFLIGVPGIKGYVSDNDHKVFYDEAALSLLAAEHGFKIDHFFHTPLIKSQLLNKFLTQYCIYTQWSKIDKA